MKRDKDLTVDIDIEGNKLREEYFDKYDDIHAEISQVTRFDESTDLSTTYLGKKDMTREVTIKAEEKFPISGQGDTNEKLLDNTECSILIGQEQVSPICQNHIICDVNHYMHYQSLLHQHREFR